MFYLILAALLWSSVFGITKTFLTDLSPVLVGCIRFGIAALLFLPFIKWKHLRGGIYKKALFMGLIYGLMFIPYIMAYRYLEGYQVGLLTVTSSLYVILINDLLFREFDLNSIFVGLVAMVGSAIILYKPGAFDFLLIGFLLIETAGICFAYSQIYFKRVKKDHPQVPDASFMGLVYCTAALVSATICTLQGQWSSLAAITSTQWTCLAYLGALPTALAFYFYNKGAARAHKSVLAVCSNIKIPVVVALSVFIFGETVNLPQVLFGSGLLFLSLIASQRLQRTATQKPAPIR